MSSVEFCKYIKFDDRKDNNVDNNQTGTKGQPGPAGLVRPHRIHGIKGPSGPVSLIEINQSTLYKVERNTVSINGSNTRASSCASCDEGDTVIGGNYAVTSFVGVPPEASFIAVQQGIVGNFTAYETSMKILVCLWDSLTSLWRPCVLTIYQPIEELNHQFCLHKLIEYEHFLVI